MRFSFSRFIFRPCSCDTDTGASATVFTRFCSLCRSARLRNPLRAGKRGYRRSACILGWSMGPSRFRPSARGQEHEACKPACLRRGSHARVVKGSLPRSAIKEPSPGFPNAGIVFHAVCPNRSLNARFEVVRCLHTPPRLEGRKLHVLSGLVGSNISASDSGFPIHTQEVTGSSPVAPTI
jgi:hypothetical protein